LTKIKEVEAGMVAAGFLRVNKQTLILARLPGLLAGVGGGRFGGKLGACDFSKTAAKVAVIPAHAGIQIVH
jgi:hypothetical protein